MSDPKCKISSKNEVWLILDADKEYKRVRKIGKVNPAKRTFITKKSQRDILRINNSIGIGHVALKTLKDSEAIDFIAVEFKQGLKERLLKTTLEYYLSNCEYLKLGNNLELQCFLPVEKFGLRTAKAWKKLQEKNKTA